MCVGYLEGQAEALTYGMERGSSRGRCLGASVPSSVAATTAAISGPSHIKALTSLGFGWIRAWSQTCGSLSHGLSRGLFLTAAYPQMEWRETWGRGSRGYRISWLSLTPPPLVTEPGCVGLLSPVFFLHCRPYLELLL